MVGQTQHQHHRRRLGLGLELFLPCGWAKLQGAKRRFALLVTITDQADLVSTGDR